MKKLCLISLCLFFLGCAMHMGQSEWSQQKVNIQMSKEKAIQLVVQAINEMGGKIDNIDKENGLITGDCEQNLQAYIIISNNNVIVKSRINFRSSEFGFINGNETKRCIKAIINNLEN